MTTVNGTTYVTKPGFTPTAGTSGYDGQMVRLATIGNALPGLFASGHLAGTQRAAGANMSLDIAAGQCYVDPQSVALQGVYLANFGVATNTAVDHGIVWPASDPTNPRIDLLCVEVRDQDFGGSFTGQRLVLLTGTPSASATHQLEAGFWPAIPTGLVPTHAVLRAPGVSGAGINTIITSQITNLNPIGGNGRSASQPIPTVETTTSTTYARLATPDIVFMYQPANARIRVFWEGLAKYSNGFGATLYINGNQLKARPLSNGAPAVAEVSTGGTTTFLGAFGTTISGLNVSAGATADVSEVATGMLASTNGTYVPAEIFGLAAGWYLVEGRYKSAAGAGTVTAQNRRMWAEVVG